MPEDSDTYLHRVARAGRFGTKVRVLLFTKKPGVYFLPVLSPGGGAKIWLDLLGGKYDYLLRKNANKYKREEVEKRGEKGKFSLPMGQKYHFWKGGTKKYTPLQNTRVYGCAIKEALMALPLNKEPLFFLRLPLKLESCERLRSFSYQFLLFRDCLWPLCPTRPTRRSWTTCRRGSRSTSPSYPTRSTCPPTSRDDRRWSFVTSAGEKPSSIPGPISSWWYTLHYCFERKLYLIVRTQLSWKY